MSTGSFSCHNLLLDTKRAADLTLWYLRSMASEEAGYCCHRCCYISWSSSFRWQRWRFLSFFCGWSQGTLACCSWGSIVYSDSKSCWGWSDMCLTLANNSGWFTLVNRFYAYTDYTSFYSKITSYFSGQAHIQLKFRPCAWGELQSAADEAVYNDAVRVTKAGLASGTTKGCTFTEGV